MSRTDLELNVTDVTIEMDYSQDMARILSKQKAEFKKNMSIDNSVRVDRLKRAIALLVENAESINEALQVDWNRPKVMTMLTDVGDPIARLKLAIKSIDKWTRLEKISPNAPFGLLGAKAFVESRPLGSVGIVSPWNAPGMLSFGPLAAAFAAGNSAMIKPSEFVPEFAALMKELVAEYFEEHELAVITGGAEAGKAFTRLPFDHLVFTGGSSVAKDVLRSASESLTPVTLELGGKSPAVIESGSDIESVALRIMSGKMMNAGQICVSPDYVFVPENYLDQFIAEAARVVQEQYPTIAANDDYCGIINKRHFDRLKSYLVDAKERGAKVIPVMESTEEMNAELKLPLHFVVNPSESTLVMQEEIFGPILPVITYNKLDEVVDYIQSKPHPLALYYFGKNSSFRNNLLANTMSGDVTINDVLFHSAQSGLPFGGVGNSGNGSCYGIEGFRRLSYRRSIYQQTKLDMILKMMRPPYTQKTLKMVAGMVKK